MERINLLVVARAEQYRNRIKEWLLDYKEEPGWGPPRAPHLKHLLWMCDQIEAHAEAGPVAKLQRWLGFVQCGMMANHMLSLQGVQDMFDEVKIAHGKTDRDLPDRLEPSNCFEADIGGEG